MFENGEVKGICTCCLKGKDVVYRSFSYLTNVRDAHVWSGGQCYPSPVHGRIVYWGGYRHIPYVGMCRCERCGFQAVKPG